MTDATLPPLAVSLGDPAGVGPELICEAWARRVEERLPAFFVVGGAGVLSAAAKSRGLDIAVEHVPNAETVAANFPDALPVFTRDDAEYLPGQYSTEGAKLAAYSLEHATGIAMSGLAAGLVTAPVSKAQLAKVGHAKYPGQTEFLADACRMRPDEAVMLLAGPQLRAVPLTIHVALAEVPNLLSIELIVAKVRILAAALRVDFGIADPHIAVTGLNPHAGEGGKFGDEEARVIAPAIANLREAGIDASGPHPADALFTARARETYDAALCMYHDQALIPLKALDFDQGVNVTLGLPIVRTSPDHGTALGIAGKGIADPGAMIAAIRMAGEIAARRAQAGKP
ncbi:4-hydroxythreonine-4-phosphate dehydrogenase PdxA [Altererythrobacter salegens]|uniref:4-hydroxythreonine-4-phosphate dehydrogenase n=1 Tax=Croceibacterium salegens TaxID=1737568 RepID=A0A6I4SSI2_9SPHN|nr:4-hydroxythreonine-4-phosphate dehydrogenase PdxA [Croceibacterium salegens]MXO58298.1 4-hydroxythreonine-4-phosphate dehydrogenase PdxA [Croceibacterium salegens]